MNPTVDGSSEGAAPPMSAGAAHASYPGSVRPGPIFTVPDSVLAEIRRCNKCGFCMAGCPTYGAQPFEWLVTRGRISLVDDVLNGRLDPDDPGFQEAVDTCLKCRACVEYCPPQIQIDHVITHARAARRARHGLGFVERLIYRGILSRPAVFKGLTRLGRLAEVTGLRRLVTRSRALNIWPVLQRAAETGPVFPAQTGRSMIEAEKRRLGPPPSPRDRVVYFLGCAKDFLYGDAALATYRVLWRNGVEVELPRVSCCGLPCHSAGDLEGARALARKNLAALSRCRAETIVVDESSCCSHLRNLGELFLGMPEEKRMRRLAERVVDLTVYLDRLGIVPPGPLMVTAGWHDPCHLRHHEGVVDAPRRLLQAVPGLTLVESTLAPGCCGGAGAIMLTQPELSDSILEAREDGFREAGAEVIVTSSPSCVTQYRRAEAAGGLPVLYISELLDRAYQADNGGSAAPSGS